MDISKLPKLSKTDAPPPANEPDGPQTPSPDDRRAYEPLPGLAEAWISIVIGLILLFASPNTIKYFHSKSSFEETHGVTDQNGNSIPYIKSNFFMPDLGVTVFAFALLVEGIALLLSKRFTLVLATFVLTLAATAFNLYVVISSYNSAGLQLVCALAVAIGGYMAMSQWRLIEILRARARLQK